MNILGISCFYHDSAAAIICNNKLLAAVQEERFSRIKHDAKFPTQSISYCLTYAGITITELDAIVFYDKPFLKFERLLETYYKNAPKGLLSFIKSMPLWLKEKLFLKNILIKELRKIDPAFKASKVNFLFTEHHLAHAASAFFCSPFSASAILTIDGVGEWATASICKGDENKITILKEMHFPDSLGLLYSSFTYFLGFKVNSGEYKLMGLAPYGNIHSPQTSNFINIIENQLVHIYTDGSLKLDQRYFNYSTGLSMVKENLWEDLFGFSIRKNEDKITQSHCNLAMAIQQVTDKIVLLLAKHTKDITGADTICLAGGVALNCVANGKLHDSGLFKDIFIQPAAGDAGGSLGAALATNHIFYNFKRSNIDKGHDLMQNAFLGPEYSDIDILCMTRKYGAVFTRYSELEHQYKVVIDNLQKGKVIGIFRGRMEFGPRALGNRSIIANPTIVDMQNQINLKIKFRESFRPFAAVTTEEDAANYFNINGKSPYMLFVKSLKVKLCHTLPNNFDDMKMEEKQQVIRSEYPAITHVDGSCRIQTCNKIQNPFMWNLLEKYKVISGHALLINTSFNVRGEPIVCTPEEAYKGFMSTGMDMLVLNDFIFLKEEQPEWKDKLTHQIYSKSD